MVLNLDPLEMPFRIVGKLIDLPSLMGFGSVFGTVITDSSRRDPEPMMTLNVELLERMP